MKINEAHFEIFCKCSLFNNIPESQVRYLYKVSREIKLNSGDYLFSEGDASNEFFIVIEGSVEITKKNDSRSDAYTLVTLGVGESIGEMALIGKEARSASVQATQSTYCLSVPFDAVLSLANTKPNIANIFIAICKKLGDRLRYTNLVTVKALESQIEQYKLRVAMANFVILLTLFLVFFIFMQIKIYSLIAAGHQTTIIGVIFGIVSVFFMVVLIKSSGLSYKDCGITRHNWKKSLIESFLFTLPVLVVLTALKAMLLFFHATFVDLGGGLFAPYVAVGHAPPDQQFSQWAITLLLYCFLSTPMQELVTRGALQTAIEKFQDNKYKTLTSILVSNAIFSSFHVVLSPIIALFIFIPGLFFGWLYSRQRNLLGVCLSHAMIGVWGFWIIGVWLPPNT